MTQGGVVGVIAQRQCNAVGGDGTDERRAADLHRADGLRGVIERGQTREGGARRKLRLIKDKDGLAVLAQRGRGGCGASPRRLNLRGVEEDRGLLQRDGKRRRVVIRQP